MLKRHEQEPVLDGEELHLFAVGEGFLCQRESRWIVGEALRGLAVDRAGELVEADDRGETLFRPLCSPEAGLATGEGFDGRPETSGDHLIDFRAATEPELG